MVASSALESEIHVAVTTLVRLDAVVAVHVTLSHVLVAEIFTTDRARISVQYFLFFVTARNHHLTLEI